MIESIPNERLLKLLEVMKTIRAFEEQAKDLYLKGLIRGTLHLSIGEEATAAGACLALKPDDYIMTTHRGHGHCIARGLDLGAMLAEILGKETGCCHGRGGSMHITDVSKGVLGADAIVGGNLPMATGVALAIQQLGLHRVVVSFLGDGACNQGTFHESLNMAALWRLPVIYVVVNNLVGNTTLLRDVVAINSLATRAGSYGMAGVCVDGNDVLEVYEVTQKAVSLALSGQGPTLIECLTYRFEGHYLGDPEVYRSKEEVREWRKRDPIDRFQQLLTAHHVLDAALLASMEDAIAASIDAAARFALDSPVPDPKSVLDYVWA